MEHQVVRSNRKTFALQIKGNSLIVRAPREATDDQIHAVVQQHSGWIEKHLAEAHEKAVAPVEKLSMEEIHGRIRPCRSFPGG